MECTSRWSDLAEELSLLRGLSKETENEPWIAFDVQVIDRKSFGYPADENTHNKGR